MELTVNSVFKFSLQELNNYLYDMCSPYTDFNQKAKTEEGLEKLMTLLRETTGLRSYLMGLQTALDVRVRCLKQQKNDPEYQSVLDKKKIVEAYVGIVDGVYQGTSRQLTVYEMLQEELKME
jgi:hypothetical protein